MMNERKLLFALTVLLFVFWGCVSVPEKHYVLSSQDHAANITTPKVCEEIRLEEVLLTNPGQAAGLNPEGFILLNWNLMKGNRDGWQKNFKKLSSIADLLTIQEARISDTLSRLLQGNGYTWDMTTAFLTNNDEVGVLNASRLTPLFLCTINYSEPLVAIPKTILVSLYPFRDSDQLLLVANVHLINFTIDTALYSNQLQTLEEFLVQHNGPLLVSGDFNSWNDERHKIIQSFANRLGLSKVTFESNIRTTFLGHVVDHVLYRGVEPLEAQTIPVSSSDHNPLLVRFRRSE